ncbi:MAG TPA: hypothetical protein VLU25_05535 [Acidobacteriota bacterium]|nr:hypothetical protein [Acidobacteriota bacterium]
MKKDQNQELEPLNLDEMGIEEIERRLEMAVAAAEAGLYCGSNCGGDCPNLECCTHTVIQPEI